MNWFVISVLQSIFDGSQGWTNALLFLVLSKKVVDFMTRRCTSVKHACCSFKEALPFKTKERQGSPVSNPVLYESIDSPSCTHNGKVTLNTSP